MEELQVKIEQSPGIITCNFKEIKEALQVQMSAYTSLEITESGIKEAKADLATLRKIRKAVDDQRKAVKSEFTAPLTEFESNVKDLLSVIDEPIDMIKGKLDEFDAKRVAEKQEHLKELYNDNIDEYAEYLPYDVVANPKWNNATYSDKDVVYDISEAVTKVKSDLYVINALGSEITEELLATYKKTGNDLKAVIQKNNDYNAAKKLAEEKVKEEQKEASPVEEKPVEPPKAVSAETKEDEVIYFKVIGTENISMVRDFCGLNGINAEEIPG